MTLDELEALCKKQLKTCYSIGERQDVNDEFIAAAREMLPKLIKAVKAAKALGDGFWDEDMRKLEAALAELEQP